MKRTAGAFLVLSGLSGCMTAEKQDPLNNSFNQASKAPIVRNVQGPRGEPIAARAMQADGVIPANFQGGPNANQIQQVSGCANGNCDASGMGHGGHGASGGLLTHPGVGPFDGLHANHRSVHGGYGGGGGNQSNEYTGGILPVPSNAPAGAVAAVGALPAYANPTQIAARTSVRFVDPAGMKVSWVVATGLGEQSLDTPFRYNFLQGGIYRLKLTSIPNRPGLELYPTIQVEPANARTVTFLAHSSVPVSLTEDDFEKVVNGNYLEKVIYLPNPEFQDVAAGLAEIVSTQLEPGVSAVEEAQKRGSILLVVRMGNIDLQAPNTPAVDAPNPFTQTPVGPISNPAGPGPAMRSLTPPVGRLPVAVPQARGAMSTTGIAKP